MGVAFFHEQTGGEDDAQDEQGENVNADGERIPVQPDEEGEGCHHEDPQANEDISVYLHGAHGRGAVTWGQCIFVPFVSQRRVKRSNGIVLA